MTVKDAELRLDQLKNGKIPPKEVPTLANPMYAKAYDGFLRFGTLCNTLREGTDQAGGYLVPDEFEKKIVDALAEKNILRKLSTVKQTRRDLKIPMQLVPGMPVGFLRRAKSLKPTANLMKSVWGHTSWQP